MTSKAPTSTWFGALALAAFQVAGTFGASREQPERRAVDAVAIVLVLLGPIALARRDRWPLAAVAVSAAAADVYVARGYAYGPVFASVAVAIFLAVRAGRRRATAVLAAAGYAGLVAASYVDPRAVRPPGLVHFALVAGWLAVVFAIGELARVRAEQAAARARAEQEEEQRRIGEQRLRLAQELHDVLAHDISLINVQASVALHLLDEQPDQARPALTTIKDASRDALHGLRTALDVLRRGEEAPRTPAPRLADLPSLVANVRASGLDVDLDVDDTIPPLPAAVELAAFRIVQEALTNVTRHAHARSVTVRVGVRDGENAGLRVEVTDDGVGGAGGVGTPGNGIPGMRERAGSLGGTVEAGPLPGGGFRVAAHLPVGQA